jgi:hypothetical protein
MHMSASRCVLCNALASHTLSHLSMAMVCDPVLNEMVRSSNGSVLPGCDGSSLSVDGQMDSCYQRILLAHVKIAGVCLPCFIQDCIMFL